MTSQASGQASRIMLVLGAFLCGLFVFFGAILLVTNRAPSIGRTITGIGGPLNLEDENGKPFNDASLKGHPYLVFFGYTHCPDVCPTTLFDMSQMLKALGPDASRVRALFITVDPERDTPSVLKDYLANFDPRLIGLTGDRAQIDAAIREYRVYAKKVPLEHGDYSMDHTAVIYLMDKNGRFVAPFDMSRTPQAEAADLHRYL